MTIAISGSRSIRDAQLVTRLLDERAIHYMGLGYELHWHLGEAQGVDALALLWARERMMAPRTIFFASMDMWMGMMRGDVGGGAQEGESLVLAADWARDGRSAGAIRNGAMIRGTDCPTPGCRGADALLTIWDGRSPGTQNARMQARMANVACQTWIADGLGEWDGAEEQLH